MARDPDRHRSAREPLRQEHEQRPDPSGTGSTNAQNLLDAHLPKQANGTNPVVMEAPNGKLTSSANSKVVKDTVASLKKAPHVTKAVSPLTSQGSAYLSKDEKIGYIPVTIGLSQSDLTEGQAQTIIDHESPAVDANFQVANGATWATRCRSRTWSRASWSESSPRSSS